MILKYELPLIHKTLPIVHFLRDTIDLKVKYIINQVMLNR